jgi:hypothetical protein
MPLQLAAVGQNMPYLVLLESLERENSNDIKKVKVAPILRELKVKVVQDFFCLKN